MRWLENHRPEGQAILSAVLFGASAPFSKLLLGRIDPLWLAGLMYLGSGIGVLITSRLLHLWGVRTSADARLGRSELLRVLAAMLTGGVAAPIVLLFSLRSTTAATASLLLNFETVATALIAGLLFRETVGSRVWLAALFVMAASAILSVDTNARWGLSIGALGVLVACFLWGLDNNIENTVSTKDPLAVTFVKTTGAGIISLIIAVVLQRTPPALDIALKSLVLGYVAYGLSIVLLLISMRKLGAARSGVLFGTAPFAGVAISLLLFHTSPDMRFVIALPLMVVGSALLLFRKTAS
ncbi:MAG: DMT family transporter [Armatimonadota bacterium]